jgi:hypothetical protein
MASGYIYYFIEQAGHMKTQGILLINYGIPGGGYFFGQ